MKIGSEKMAQAEFREAYLANEQQVRIGSGKIACALVFFLMPLGATADYFVYPEHLFEFLKLRLLCSLLIVGVWLLHYTSLARKNYPMVGLMIVLLPAFFMTGIIYKTEGLASPYYAALNLILLAVSVVGHWGMAETLIAVGSVIGIYLITCLSKDTHEVQFRLLFLNTYFLILTGIIVVCGNYLFNRLRFSEFVLRFELDKSKKALEQKTADLENAIVRLKEAEAELVQSEKLASLGRMSAGIIHEINNPLNFTTTALFTLKEKGRNLPPGQQQEYADILRDVEDGMGRVKQIVSDLRMFTHPDTESREPVELADTVNSALRFFSGELRDKVQINLKLAEQQTVWANRNKLIHVLVNLLQNSFDALGRKSFDNEEKPAIWIEGRVENVTSRLIIRDNGAGIKPEDLDKIFDPFFTTKDVGEGMGLGLSICHRIVREYGGRIRVQSQPGKFCEFTLEFSAKG